MIIAPHSISIALVHPQIPPNTGNIARLCVATGTDLHLVRPIGFLLDDRQIRRSAMDYWPRLRLTLHDDVDAFLDTMVTRRLRPCENGVGASLWKTEFADGDVLVLGSETAGLPQHFIDRFADSTVNIPQVAGERCLNLSTASGIVLFEALRQVHVRNT